ncbi:MAG: translesion error-prone DNA polymerase V autoproteolytic subunit [Parachlamydiaceae bacterium]|nr:translesion error-prone DNA polymerase V autoproteolytic subunit [Parachlamydiaceae bacterium]
MVQGGKRTGAGRPQGSGKYKEPTKAIRVPANEIDSILSYIQRKFYRLPLYHSTISAGFPSPAEDDVADKLDLNELLIKHPSATFFLRVSGVSMVNAGIHHNDILIVDRSVEPTNGKVVIASVNGELTVKRLRCEGKKIQLVAENEAYAPIDISEDADFRVWGVVTNVIHSL